VKDPRASILLVVLLSIGVIGTGSIRFLVMAVGCLLLWTLLARLPLKSVIRGARSILWFVLAVVFFNLFSTEGTVVISIAGLYGTFEGLLKGGLQATRLAVVLWGSMLLVHTTRSEGFLDAAEWAVRKRGFPPLTVAVLSLLYLPVLVNTARRVREARLARGETPAEGMAGGIWFAATSALPLFAAALRSSDHLADAMDSRCYQSLRPRTPFNVLRMNIVEIGILAGIIMALAGALTGYL
jgi:energy-coupling factor transport system permease protein